MASTTFRIQQVQYTVSEEPDPTGWAELRERLTNPEVKLNALQEIPHYATLLRALEQIYTPGVDLGTGEALSIAAGLLIQVENLLSLPWIEVAFGKPIRFSSIYLEPQDRPTITCGWKLQKQPGDERPSGTGAKLQGPIVSGVINPIAAHPRLVLPFPAVTVVGEHDGSIRNILHESRCYGACMIANMLEVKKAIITNALEPPNLIVDSGCIRALTLTITSRRIVLMAHWAIQSADAPPYYYCRIVNVWEANMEQGFPIRDAFLSIHLAREWIVEANTQPYYQIIQKVYGLWELTCCTCNRPRDSLDHDITCWHMLCSNCDAAWQEPNY